MRDKCMYCGREEDGEFCIGCHGFVGKCCKWYCEMCADAQAEGY